MGFSLFYMLAIAFMGACFGSFAALIIYRLTIGQSIVWPRSYCQSCKKQILIRHNIPIFSWLLLRGKCFFCQKRVGVRSLFIELLLAICLLGLYLKFGLSMAMLDRFFFIFLLVCLAYVDLDTFFLPLNLLFLLIFLGIAFSVFYIAMPQSYVPPGKPFGPLYLMVLPVSIEFSFADRIIGAAVGALFLLVINLVGTYILRKIGRLGKMHWAMGFGDPLLIFAIGLFVGMSHLIVVIFLASLLGSLVGIVSRFFSAEHSQNQAVAPGALPYGPFLALAAIYTYIV